MTRRQGLAIAAFATVLLALPWQAAAQGQTPPGNTWSHGTTLDLFGGAAMAPSTDARAAVGGTIGWEINQRVEVEGAGAWIVPRDSARAFTAELKGLFNLTKPNTAVPFVGGGVGMYIATFDAGSAAIPPFYQPRMSGAPAGSTQSFTDPSLILTGGVSILASRHVSVRPEVSVRWVLHDSDSYAVTVAVVHFIYHFEEHVIGR